jgi:hypothetical protein
MDSIFEKPLRKVRAVKVGLINNSKYVNKFDALSLSTVDLEEGGEDSASSFPQVVMPKMTGLCQLTDALHDILNEAYIEQQTITPLIHNKLKECENIAEMIGRNIDVDSAASQDKQKTLEMTAKSQLQDLHGRISNMVDIKLSMTEMIKIIKDCYFKALTQIAQESNVLSTVPRARLVVLPTFDTLLTDRFFNIQDESASLRTLAVLWARVFLKGESTSDVLMAEKHLSTLHVQSSTSALVAAEGLFYIKVGAIAILLLWSFSECLYNEARGQAIWHVSRGYEGVTNCLFCFFYMPHAPC